VSAQHRRYLDRRPPLLIDMHRRTEPRTWRTLSSAEKQDRLDRLRRHQRQQVLRDAQTLLLHLG